MNTAFRLPGLVSIVAAFMLSVPAQAADPVSPANASIRIEQAFHRVDAPALASIAATLAVQGRVAGANSRYLDYYIGYANYASANLMIARADDSADARVGKARAALERAVEAAPDFAEAHALLASVYGLEIALHPWKGMWLGRRIGEQMDRATALAPGNPRITLMRALDDWHKPAAFGGDRQQALREFGQAIAEFDRYAAVNPLAPTWGRAEAYALRASGEAASGNIVAARRDYQTALSLAPDYVAARNALAKLAVVSDPAAGFTAE